MSNDLTTKSNRLHEFDEFYQNKLKQKLLQRFNLEPKCIQNVIKRFDEMIDYNVPHGKKLRGLCVYESFLHLMDIDPQDPKSTFNNFDSNVLIDQAKAIGWCIEFLQGAFLVADDIMDNSKFRRGQPCWYLNDGVGTIAINDSFFLISNVFTLITEYLGNHPNYSKLFEIFNETFTNTVVGQGIDLITPPKRNAGELFNFENYKEEQYYSIVKWKTAFYSFSLPVQAALYVAFIDNPEVHQKCKDILIDMGCFFQVQDDFLDCYGDPKVTGKVGTDIEESKCGWLVIQALKKCNAEQRQILEKHYGLSDQESVKHVKELYNQLNLSEEYSRFEQSEYERITTLIENLSFETAYFDSDQTERVRKALRIIIMSDQSKDKVTKNEDELTIEEKKEKLEKQIIYYSHAEQVDLATYDVDVESIDLSLTRLKSIGDFSRFTNLKSICFRSNLLKTFQDENFKVENGLQNILELDFYDNQIEVIENLNQFKTLQALDLSFNRLEKIENLNELVELKKLYLVHNKFSKIQNLENLTKLEILELGDNQFRTVEKLEKLKNLTQLYLGKNKIKRIEGLDLPNLRILSLQSNRLTRIENLDSLVNLEELYLSENGITKIEGLEKLNKLKVLDLSLNLIEIIENIQELNDLEELWFNGNNLSKWEYIEVLRHLPKLKCLYLEHNPIFYINNIKPTSIGLLSDNQKFNPDYRRKIIFSLPHLEQLDATLISKPSITH
ncbi:unnamed protein product [Brachionus calyciflorus]|uniref:Farnesyl pyrophosphate synthase n=1 Tax=Brachionus calyciflorus TaxID=104777 RepID=A0A813WHY8_9BILA|nr:unnamed protein product [Brachionus calyciflorus]